MSIIRAYSGIWKVVELQEVAVFKLDLTPVISELTCINITVELFCVNDILAC